MLRRREINDEIQMLKSQINELKDELNKIKSSIKSDIHKSYGDYSIGSSIGKTLGKALFKGFTQADYNKQLISQFYKFSSSTIHSFGDDNKNEF
jgi:sugar-specific transcriptional regulator TrmB